MAYILSATTPTGTAYYNGKAGPAWVSADRSAAWTYVDVVAASRAALRFNEFSALHGLTFDVVRQVPA